MRKGDIVHRRRNAVIILAGYLRQMFYNVVLGLLVETCGIHAVNILEPVWNGRISQDSGYTQANIIHLKVMKHREGLYIMSGEIAKCRHTQSSHDVAGWKSMQR